ncbi:MAG: hypothetical protein FWE27_04375 [Defluviitaleaceae bacterium]|nr:hypothetical protein [Defluviitaleaceae bacterium]
MCQKYLELSGTAQIKASKITDFFNELSALIFEDIQKSFAKKMQQVIHHAKTATDDKATFEGLTVFKEALSDAITFTETLPTGVSADIEQTP